MTSKKTSSFRYEHLTADDYDFVVLLKSKALKAQSNLPFQLKYAQNSHKIKRDSEHHSKITLSRVCHLFHNMVSICFMKIFGLSALIIFDLAQFLIKSS